MKKTLSFLALAALLAGCSANDPAVTGKSPWSIDGNTGSSGNPLARNFTGAEAPREYTPVTRHTYSWDADKPVAATEDAPAIVAPEDASKAVITGIRGEMGLLSLARAEKPEAGQTYFLINKDNHPVRVRIVTIQGDAIIAELTPNQAGMPVLNIGEHVSLVPEMAPAHS